MFQDGGDTLKNLTNKDVVSSEIQEYLLSAEHLGQAQMKVVVDKRLCEPPDSDHHLNRKAHIQNNTAQTFASLYEVVQPSEGKQNIIKVGRNILQIFITAYRAGLEVNLENILQHERMTVPLYLATTSGSLHSTNKAVLANILTQQVQNTATVILDEPRCLLIDSQSLTMAYGKPPGIRTFGDYANIFCQHCVQDGSNIPDDRCSLRHVSRRINQGRHNDQT